VDEKMKVVEEGTEELVDEGGAEEDEDGGTDDDEGGAEDDEGGSEEDTEVDEETEDLQKRDWKGREKIKF
jgi:hypothetical protein